MCPDLCIALRIWQCAVLLIVVMAGIANDLCLSVNLDRILFAQFFLLTTVTGKRKAEAITCHFFYAIVTNLNTVNRITNSV